MLRSFVSQRHKITVTTSVPEITLAVLPFNIISAADTINPLAQGFTEDLITNFSKFVGLSVVSNWSVQGVSPNADQVQLQRLGADYWVTGSFRSKGDQVRINVQLVRASDQQVVHAKQYDEQLTTLFDTQDDIVHQIVSTLRQLIDHDILSYSYQKETVQLEAHENWLLGMAELRKGTSDSDLKARQYFEAALRIAPTYARAYSGISLSYFNEWTCQLWERWEVSQMGAHKYALKGLERDENDYVSLAVLGRTYLYAGDFDKSEHCLRKALQMNPNDAQNLIRIGFSMVFLGLAEEAVALYHRACILNPLHQRSYFAYGANFYFEAGDFAKCIELGKQVELDMAWVDFPVFLAAAYYHIGDTTNALLYWEHYLKAFKQHIIRGEETDVREALHWQIEVNPYKDGKTLLQPFWDFIQQTQNMTAVVVSAPVVVAQKAAFQQKGEVWQLTFQDENITLKDAKGLHDIHKLLGAPEQEFHCGELIGLTLQADNVSVQLDEQSKRSYQQRIQVLQVELQEAEQMNDLSKVSTLRTEYEQLIEHLAQAMGRQGKTRRTGSSVEKARSAVTWRIRNSIKKIEQLHPALGRHLTLSIKTGTLCTYQPEAKFDWIL